MSSGNIKSPDNKQAGEEWMQRISRRSYNPIMYYTTTSVGNTAGNIERLHSYTLPIPPGSHYWKGNNQSINLLAFGTCAPNPAAKTIEVYFAAQLMFTYVAGLNENFWRIDSQIARLAVDEFLVYTYFFIANFGTGTHTIQRGSYFSAGVRLGEGAVIEVVGGSAGFANDVQCQLFKVEQFSGPNAY